MGESFDPYLKWLGIPLGQQPPNPYRLLGIEPFETDPEVIENAADRQMAHLRTFQSGPHREACQRLLNEVASARIALLDDQRKGAIDRRLKAQLAADPPPARRAVKVAKPLVSAKSPPSTEPVTAGKAVSGKGVSGTAAASRPIPVGTVGAVGAGAAGSGAAVGAEGAAAGEQTAMNRARHRAGRRGNSSFPWELVKVGLGAAAGLVVAVMVLQFALGIDLLGIFPAPEPVVVEPGGLDPGTPGQPPVEPGLPTVRDPERPDTGDPPSESPFLPLDASADPPPVTPPSPAAEPDGSPQFFGVRGLALNTADDLGRAIREVEQAIPAFDAAFAADGLSNEQRRQQSVELFDAFCRLGAVIAVCDYRQPAVADQSPLVNEHLNAIADVDDKLTVLGSLASEQIGKSDQHGRGLLISGRVIGIEGHQRLYRTRVELAGEGSPTISIYTWRDPAPLINEQDPVLILGVLVDDPERNLAGYRGDESTVVWGGFMMRLRRG